jgi:hypothetical protein
MEGKRKYLTLQSNLSHGDSSVLENLFYNIQPKTRSGELTLYLGGMYLGRGKEIGETGQEDK